MFGDGDLSAFHVLRFEYNSSEKSGAIEHTRPKEDCSRGFEVAAQEGFLGTARASWKLHPMVRHRRFRSSRLVFHEPVMQSDCLCVM